MRLEAGAIRENDGDAHVVRERERLSRHIPYEASAECGELAHCDIPAWVRRGKSVWRRDTRV